METILKNKNSFLNAIATGTFMLIAATGFAQKNQTKVTNEAEAIRPYHISISQEALTDLRTRVNATRWPDKETVTDQSQGVKLQQIQNLI